MKAKILLVLMFSIFFSKSYAHKEWVHQYIVQQAYNLLVNHYSFELPEIAAHLGDTGPGEGPWRTGSILTGAWREDMEDFIGNSGSWSGNHFWEADISDVQTNWIVNYGDQINAYQKVFKYAYGGWTLEYMPPGVQNTYVLKYNSLVDLYKNGNLHQVGYYDAIAQYYSTDIWFVASTELRNILVWEILGRMCHLLADMSVPAHVHFDQHLCEFPSFDPDEYEVLIAGSTYGQCSTQGAGTSYYMNYNSQTAFNNGGFINPYNFDSNNPLRYLFYSTNQIADHFPSSFPYKGGDNNLINGTYPGLQETINSMGPAPNTVNIIQIADVCMNQVIKATAGLIYWFATECDLMKSVTITSNQLNDFVQVRNPARSISQTSQYSWKPTPYTIKFDDDDITVDLLADAYSGTHYFLEWEKRDKDNITVGGNSGVEWLNANAQATSTFIANYTPYVTLSLNSIQIESQSANAYYENITTGEISTSFTFPVGFPITVKAVAPQEYLFAGWSDCFIENPRSFNLNSNLTGIYATFKKIESSNNSNAYSFNGQNKFLKTPDGYLHNVYESMGRVWYERSIDGGTNWEIMNNGWPINYNDGSDNAKSPAISSSNDSDHPYIYITYQAENVWGAEEDYVLLTQFINGTRRWTEFVGNALPAYSYDTRPVVTGLNGFAMVVYKSASNAAFTGVEFRVDASGNLTQIIPRSFPSAYVSGNSTLPSITNSGGIYHLAYQDAVFTIRYLRWFVNTNPLTSNYYSIPSTGSGYYFNTEPSISCANFNPVISWKGAQYTGTRQAVLRRGTLSGSTMIWSDFLKVGSTVNYIHSNSANNFTEKTVMSWSQDGSITKWVSRTYYVNGKTGYSTSPLDLTPFGINSQVSSGTDFNNMKANIFRSSAPLYYFTLSTTNFGGDQSEGGLEKITMDDTLVTFGRSGVADINGVEFVFNMGDVLVGDRIIQFIDKPDTIVYASSNELNEFTRTNNFTLNQETNFYFSNIYYVVQKSNPDSALTNTDAVIFKVELVNALTNQVVGIFDNITYNKDNLEKYASIDYEVDCSGITPGDYYLRLVTNINGNANYALANIISDNTTLAKKKFNKVNFTGSEIPTTYDLAQNFPNPFNPSTTIRYQIPQNGIVTLKIYDILGAEVATLVNEEKVAGKYEVNFNASSLASGVYIYKIQAGSFVNSKKMILLK